MNNIILLGMMYPNELLATSLEYTYSRIAIDHTIVFIVESRHPNPWSGLLADGRSIISMPAKVNRNKPTNIIHS
jgi:hypothetical protein